MSGLRPLTERLALLLLAALWLCSVVAWPDLPERIPLHFGVSGLPDRWGEKSILNWFLLPLIGTGTVLMAYGVRWLMVRFPKSTNMPNKEQYLKLGPEARRAVHDEIEALMHMISVSTLLVFSLLQLAIFRNANGQSMQAVMMTGLVLWLAVVPILCTWMIVRVHRSVGAAYRRQMRTKGTDAR